MDATGVAILFSYAWPLVLLALVFAFRNYFSPWFKRLAEHGFDEKLELLRGDIRKNEAHFAAQLTIKQKEFDSLRDNALSGSANRRAALDIRKLQAVDMVWAGVLSLSQLKLAANLMGYIDFDAASKDAKNKDFYSAISKSFDLTKLPPNEAAKQRPFISETAWAYYSAYSAVIFYAALQLKTLELGINSKYLKSDSIDKLVVAALPHYKDYVDQYGASGYHLLLDELENRLLVELRNMLDGTVADAEAIAAAANILKVAETVQAEAAAGMSAASARS